MEIYIKPVKKILLEQRQDVYLQDITEIISDVSDKLKHEKVFKIPLKIRKNYVVSITDIIKIIKKKFPDYSVINLGEKDTIIDYSPVIVKENQFLKILRIIFVCIVLFMGAATAIMSFHSDAQIPDVFKNYYKIFFGYELDNPKIIAVPYSIGLAVGIIVFFNHLGNIKITRDPTPIEVEMSLYDTDIYNTLVDSIQTEQNNTKKEIGGG